MKILFTLLFSLCMAGISSAETFDIDGKIITVPNPQGFTKVTPDMTAVHEFSKLLVDPANDMLAYYIQDSDVAVAQAQEMPMLEKTCMLKIGKQLITKIVSQKEFEELKNFMKENNKTMHDAVKDKIPEVLDEQNRALSEAYGAEFKIGIERMIPYDVYYEDENAFAYPIQMVMNDVVDGVPTKIVLAMAMACVNVSGKVVYLYSYAPEDEMESVKTSVQSWSESILASNTAPPTGSSTGSSTGINWERVGEKAVLGAIIGGLIAVIGGFFRRFKKKKS
jgi:hypothetical protein